jgi:hypothetical protein
LPCTCCISPRRDVISSCTHATCARSSFISSSGDIISSCASCISPRRDVISSCTHATCARTSGISLSGNVISSCASCISPYGDVISPRTCCIPPKEMSSPRALMQLARAQVASLRPEMSSPYALVAFSCGGLRLDLMRILADFSSAKTHFGRYPVHPPIPTPTLPLKGRESFWKGRERLHLLFNYGRKVRYLAPAFCAS